MNSKNLARFVLMRFNVKIPGFEHLDNNDPDWLEYRLGLAELTSFHSLRYQSLREFKLVILISPATPESFITSLKVMTQDLDVILFKTESAAPKDMASTLIRNADAECLAVQTSRIDSDDMYHPDYLQNIHEYCIRNNVLQEIPNGPRYFRYPSGQDYLAQSSSYQRILYPENAFGTLIEPVRDGLLTVYCENHKRMSRRFTSQALEDDKPMWCRILHGSNLLNKPRKRLPLTGHFPVHPGLADFAKRPVVHPRAKHAPSSQQ